MGRNKFGIPEEDLQKIRIRDIKCVYCHKDMIHPGAESDRRDWATIEHLNFDGPFYWADGLDISDIVICCGGCNSSRGVKMHQEWFSAPYCQARGINLDTVAEPVKSYLRRKILEKNTASGRATG